MSRSTAYSSTGKYTLSITPQKAYDSYEPNNDVLSAAPIAIGTPIAGNIIDDKDVRWFRITGATKKTIHVVFDNQSTTLKPEVKIFSATKSQIGDKYDGTSGANLDFTIDVEPKRLLPAGVPVRQHRKVQGDCNRTVTASWDHGSCSPSRAITGSTTVPVIARATQRQRMQAHQAGRRGVRPAQRYWFGNACR